LTIGPNEAGKELIVTGGHALIKTDERGVDLIVPLAAIRYSPIEVSAESHSIYFHALKPFTELVVSLEKEMKEDWRNIQLFRLNPEHQMPVPEFDSIEVKMK